MSAKILGQHDNNLILSLPRTQRHNLLDHCERVDLLFGDVLCIANQKIEYVYFPETSILSLVTILTGHSPLGINLIGDEGMLGVILVLGDNLRPLHGALVQNAGTALRMKASLFRQQFHTSPKLQLKLNHYLYKQILQMSQSLGCAHFHEIEPRLARWLLMTQDRAHSDHFHLTHKLLADSLGVRRSGVTIAAGALQNKNFIAYNRGDITVLDRTGLKAAACECYCEIKTNWAGMPA